MTLGYANPNDAMDDVIDPQEEMLKLASAFRLAEEADTIEANNIIAKATSQDFVKSKKYHVIEMAWFRRASPVLAGTQCRRDEIGLMVNEPLWDPNSLLICTQFEHGVDYVVVGPNVWLLLSQKFGYDRDIQVPLIYSPGRRDARVHLQLSPSACTPLLGRFPYEKYLEASPQNNDTVVSDDPTVGEEEDDTQMEPDYAVNDQIILLPPPITQPTRRKYGSGLGNLGNTCFMNSTLQCLAHTEPLKRYFLSGEYRQDLNADNPLGTGGDLAIKFGSLLLEMWTGDDPVTGGEPVVYPRQFKTTLGKHAEQFVGYDQHDSQELATYLLDALHEDCNRVTRKPYFEKPEQGADESDEEAARKAWDLHLQRDDSRVLENFMGQVKSRLECPICNRVSTTFDPFMFLSVPIPGSEERSILIHYVPLNPRQRTQKLHVTVSKLASIQDLIKATLELRKEDRFRVPSNTEDVAVADTWNYKIWSWLPHKDTVDVIKDTDVTFMYELDSACEIRKLADKSVKPMDLDIEKLPTRQNLNIASLTRLNSSTSWKNEVHNYLVTPLMLENALNPRKGTREDRVRVYHRFTAFIKDCYGTESPKRTREEMEKESELSIYAACEKHSKYFKDVKTSHDVAILEFITKKIHAEILRLESAENLDPAGVVLEIKLRKEHETLAEPLVIRVPPTTTVYELRQLVARRLQRCLRNGTHSAGEPTAECAPDGLSPEKLFLRLPLTYERKSRTTVSRIHVSKTPLGSLPIRTPFSPEDDCPKIADSSNAQEQEVVAKIVGDEGKVFFEFSDESFESIDLEEYKATDERQTVRESKEGKKALSVFDCIEKYCQREQLEESERWYCSQCKERVSAWKQFQIFRSPPHLIVHLKRFQFSANTHRRQKIGSFVDFPLEGLDLCSHVAHWDEAEKPIYDCYAVSNHFGGLGGGHYTAYCLNEGNVWCNYDDSRISKVVDPNEVVSESAYVLYYRRRDVSLDQEYEINLTTPVDSKPAPVVISDSYARQSYWDTTRISSDAAMVDDEDVDVASNGSNAAVGTPDSTPGSFSNSDHDIENQYDDPENDPLIGQ